MHTASANTCYTPPMSTSARPPHHTVFAPVTGEAPVYWECPSCGYISGDPRFADPDFPCAFCHDRGGERRTYPTDRIRRLDERIRQYHRDADHEIVVILVMAFLETILEDMLDRLMTAHGADLAVRKMLMDTERAIGLRLGKVFPSLTGAEFEDVAEELGYRDFPKRWRTLRDARNAFIHDSPYNGARETLQPSMGHDAMALLDQAYKLFVLVNNKYVADGLHRD